MSRKYCTLPGVLTGLLQADTPVLLEMSFDDAESPELVPGVLLSVEQKNEDTVGYYPDERVGWGRYYAVFVHLDLSREAGKHRACMWLAEQLGCTDVEGAVWHRSWRGYYELHVWSRSSRGRALEFSFGDRFSPGGNTPRSFRVTGVEAAPENPEGELEALRLTCLTVATEAKKHA